VFIIVLILLLVAVVVGYLYLEGGASHRAAPERNGAGRPGEAGALSQGSGADARKGAAEAWERSPEEISALPRVELGPSLGLGYWFEVVADSHHQRTLRAADGGRLAQRKPVDVPCLIVPEPQNPYDKTTVAVYIDGFGKVGRFSRQDAKAYQGLARRLLDRGEVGACRGELVGRDPAGSLAVFLDLEEPEAPEGGGRMPTPLNAVYASGWESRPRVPVGPGKTFALAVIEASRFQSALRKLDAGRLAGGEPVSFAALLVPEPEHPGRPRSILVCADGIGPVGRLSKAACEKYAGLTAALEASGRVGACPGRLSAEHGVFAVKLSVPAPSKAAAAAMMSL
jgi:hypothetical protein